MQDYPDAESWSYLDKMICQWRIEEEKARAACGKVPVTPYGRCQLFRGQAPTSEWLAEEAGQVFVEQGTPSPTLYQAEISSTEHPTSSSFPTSESTVNSSAPVPPTIPSSRLPTMQPKVAGTSVPSVASPPSASQGVPPLIDCQSYANSFSGFTFDRMCQSTDPCCESTRSATNFCWDTYELFGDSIVSACYHCCATPKKVPPPTPEKTDLPKTIQCSSVVQPNRICDGCCSNPRSTASFCQEQYALFGQDIEQVCYYCCSTPLVVGSARRNLRFDQSAVEDATEARDEDAYPDGTKVLYMQGKKYVFGPENFDDDGMDEEEYYEKLLTEHRLRNLQAGPHAENYEDIDWFPYEWLIKVGTEYYYRYEGTMPIPPCWETVHWRLLKDPIRVHKRQIDELHRLLAWRLNPDTCKVDTAGVLSADGNRVEVNREVQYTHTQHREVFCECKDWPSHFSADNEWCHKWQNDTTYDRFYKNPYSFDSGRKWLP
jgi:Eukaryotic-type carbonic anhydrase